MTTQFSISGLPKIIQAGMGVNISSYQLAKTCSKIGGWGTVSGVAPDRILALALQQGDVGGHYRRALSHFPFPEIAQMVLDAYYTPIPEKSTDKQSLKGVPVYSVNPSKLLISLIVCANFAFIWLAKEGHDNTISINYLEKIAMPHIYAFTGAMLAGVDAMTVGAGNPHQIPEVINALVEGRVLKYHIPIVGEREPYEMSFDPEKFFGAKLPNLKKPKFLPIVSSNVLAERLVKKSPAGSIFGFIVETSTAGGHNAPPRVKGVFDEHGNPVYGEKDKVDYIELAGLGRPYWIGGSYASPEMLAWALQQGAEGIQVGSALALCEESGLRQDLKVEARRLAFLGQLDVRTDPRVSPSGFPFKVAVINGTLSEENVYKSRVRICDKGVLVVLYKKADGSIGYRCSAEPVHDFVGKGGKIEDTVGAGCICNGLITTAGLKNGDEPPIVTLGDDLRFAKILMANEKSSYTAADVYKYLLS